MDLVSARRALERKESLRKLRAEAIRSLVRLEQLDFEQAFTEMLDPGTTPDIVRGEINKRRRNSSSAKRILARAQTRGQATWR